MLDAAAFNTALSCLGDTARDLSELKRMRDQSTSDSVASRLFRRAWARLEAGVEPLVVCHQTVADALVATRLAGIDAAMLEGMAVDGDARLLILSRSFDDASGRLSPSVIRILADAIGVIGAPSSRPPAPFIAALIAQPRAGATAPGKARLALEPAESHGDHCLVVAVLGALIAMQMSADPRGVFIAGLAHHLHNAALPDTGFAGEVMLGDDLAPLMRRLVGLALQTLDPPLRHRVEQALLPIADANTVDGRAFNAADVIDRVLQAHHHARAAAFTADQALGDLQLVHEGPLQAFHLEVLSLLRLA